VIAGARRHSVWRERLIAGVAAATLVLCWFMLFDGLTAGTPWLTAQRMGAAGVSVVINGRGSPTLVTSLIVFSVFHYGGWIAIAGLVLGVVHRARKQPSLLLAALLLSVMAFVPVVGVSTMLGAMGWGSATRLRFMVAALIGGMTVAAQAYRAHAELVRYEFAHIDDDG
jgi:hypothetical protein